VTVYGIDIASYQATTFNTTNLGFVMVKATEGTGYVNPHHDAQIAYGRSHNLIPGHYHFQRPGSPTAQAAFFLQHARPQAGDILACDWEDQGVSDDAKDAFIRAVRAAHPHLRTLLYCDLSFWLDRDRTGFYGDGLWIADPEAAIGHPRVTAPWTMHQYGIQGTDRDVANFPDLAAMRAWANGTKPPAPKPNPKPLVAAKSVRLHVAVWAATHSAVDERRYPQNEPETYAIQRALVANKHLTAGHFIPGIFDTPTLLGYKAEQEAQGYRGKAADGIPGLKSLTHLGRQHGFTVAA
jgi:Lyzozyme M1 (1,4-beta-N-acetylmuramidase)